MALYTFCLLSPATRAHPEVENVQPESVVVRHGGRTTRFAFTCVLSTTFDLPHYILTPLVRRVGAEGGAAALVLCAPSPHGGGGDDGGGVGGMQDLVLGLLSRLLESVFAAAGGRSAVAEIQLYEVRGANIVDADRVCRVQNLTDVAATEVHVANAAEAWSELVLEKLHLRYAVGATAAEDSAFFVEVTLTTGGGCCSATWAARRRCSAPQRAC